MCIDTKMQQKFHPQILVYMIKCSLRRPGVMENVLNGLYVSYATLRYITRLNAVILTQSVIFFLSQTKKTNH